MLRKLLSMNYLTDRALILLSPILLIGCTSIENNKMENDLHKDFQMIWETVRDEFYDSDLKGLDWNSMRREFEPRAVAAGDNEAFAKIVNDMLNRLDTSHTAYYPPDQLMHSILLDLLYTSESKEEATKRQIKKRPKINGIGLFSQEIDGRIFIDQILNGSPAEEAGLLVGDEIVSVDGERFHPISSFAGPAKTVILSYRRRAEASPKIVKIRAKGGAPLDLFNEAIAASVQEIKRDHLRIGYIRMWSLVDTEPLDLLTQAWKGPEGQIDALILDLRGRIGGNIWRGIVHSLQPAFGVKCFQNRKNGEWCDPLSRLKGRMVAIVDHHTRSAAEIVAFGFRKNELGPLVGTTTQGSVTTGDVFLTPGGGILLLGIRSLSFDGQVLEKVGITPDVMVPMPLPYAAGADPQLEAAVRIAIERATQ